jgi:hypothetical protein
MPKGFVGRIRANGAARLISQPELPLVPAAVVAVSAPLDRAAEESLQRQYSKAESRTC